MMMSENDVTGEALAARAAVVLARRGRTVETCTQAQYAAALDIAEMELEAAEEGGAAAESIPMALRATPIGRLAIDMRVQNVLAEEGLRFEDIDQDEYLRRYSVAEQEVYPIAEASP